MCWNETFRELHAAGLLHLYTHTSFVTSLSGSEVFCYSKATSAHALSIHCDRGKKNAHRTPVTPTATHITCQLNAYLVPAISPIYLPVTALGQKDKTSLLTMSRSQKRNRQLGWFRCLPMLLDKFVHDNRLIKLQTKKDYADFKICQGTDTTGASLKCWAWDVSLKLSISSTTHISPQEPHGGNNVWNHTT